jgi:GH25 family lysozyme M1 (1,4-beta-N-acetylmuramidase)
MSQLSVDCSNYQGDLPQAVFDSWRDAGCKTVICGTDGSGTNPIVFPQQAFKAATAGMNVEAYIYLYFGANGVPSDVLGRTRQKLNMIRSVGGIKRVWIDCEDTTSGLAPSDLLHLIGQACDAVRAEGYEVGIYTGGWWWRPYTADSTQFSHLPLWTADYDGNADLEFSSPFGGWSSLYRKQYTDKGRLGIYGADLDLNAEVESAAAPPPVDDYSKQAGRSEMYLGIKRDLPGIPVGAVEAWLDALPEAWGIQV